MRELTNLGVMIGAFSGASIPHLGHPVYNNALWLVATSFASASIALYGRAITEKWKARHATVPQEAGYPDGNGHRDDAV